jgi:hypothetical protein
MHFSETVAILIFVGVYLRLISSSNWLPGSSGTCHTHIARLVFQTRSRALHRYLLVGGPVKGAMQLELRYLTSASAAAG